MEEASTTFGIACHNIGPQGAHYVEMIQCELFQ